MELQEKTKAFVWHVIKEAARKKVISKDAAKTFVKMSPTEALVTLCTCNRCGESVFSDYQIIEMVSNENQEEAFRAFLQGMRDHHCYRKRRLFSGRLLEDLLTWAYIASLYLLPLVVFGYGLVAVIRETGFAGGVLVAIWVAWYFSERIYPRK